MVWKRKNTTVDPTIPTNTLGDAVADAEDGRLQAQAEAQRLADANFTIDSQSEDGVDSDGFQDQELNTLHDG